MSEQGNVEVNVNPAAKEDDELGTSQNQPNVVADPAATPDNPNPDLEGQERPQGDPGDESK